tara:strand:- start:468 stop:767 length:300 start_codon:yes stop_codon:yes gene_type:complete
MNSEKKGVYIYANLLDINSDGNIDMISFLSPDGNGIALVVKSGTRDDLNHIHMLQDITGDGKLDNNDINIIKRESLKIFNNPDLKEGQLKFFVIDAEYS